MNTTEQHVNLAAKLYSCRDACKTLWGKNWKMELEFYTNLIHAVMKKHGIDNEVKAAMFAIEECADEYGKDVFTMKILAAAVEIIEPTE
ncbi:MAG: hypothetical protein A2W93_14170 [Bacteroidetes bacterium GWF2_43_63]|nr:MAG: hypothetical protein A2W94_00740 [Bacteroidetes bacterium GWE2_42_42]OFY52487.1 MAG: hypothetical protein A2W93_14170 [Bacteroidetes bacterium GWF2_43_63]HBG71393.1 hypothetical protein [Bacteroidales bacterium]HCB60855.1 hypothetical protein [Bacteroidales bacterium]HCY23420.1 hypothetical protein [Bacteroidales bacterium]